MKKMDIVQGNLLDLRMGIPTQGKNSTPMCFVILADAIHLCGEGTLEDCPSSHRHRVSLHILLRMCNDRKRVRRYVSNDMEAIKPPEFGCCARAHS
jgi:hypothetical protein